MSRAATDGYLVATTGKLVRYPEGRVGHLDERLIDRAGRFWVRDSLKVKTWVWDGTAWAKRDHHTVAAFEDSGGRVFLFDGTAVRVRDKDGTRIGREWK